MTLFPFPAGLQTCPPVSARMTDTPGRYIHTQDSGFLKIKLDGFIKVDREITEKSKSGKIEHYVEFQEYHPAVILDYDSPLRESLSLQFAPVPNLT